MMAAKGPWKSVADIFKNSFCPHPACLQPPDLQPREAVNEGGRVVAGRLCLSGVLLCVASGGQTGQAETVTHEHLAPLFECCAQLRLYN